VECIVVVEIKCTKLDFSLPKVINIVNQYEPYWFMVKSLAEKAPIVDCDVCLSIVEYLNERGEVKLGVLDGTMRTNEITTTTYHIKNHLEPNEFVFKRKRGLIRKVTYVSITDKGREILGRTLARKGKKKTR